MTPSRNKKRKKPQKENPDISRSQDSQNSLTLKDFLGNVQTVILIFGAILGAIAGGRNLVETHPYGLVITIFILVVITSAVIMFQMWGRQETIKRRVFIIPASSFAIATIATVVFVFKSPPCEYVSTPFAEDEFGVLVANFTTSKNEGREGVNFAKETYDAIETKINRSKLQRTVKIQRTCEVYDRDEADKIGQEQNAKLVVWGNVIFSEALSEYYLDLSITPVKPIKEYPKALDLVVDNSIDFQVNVSEQITAHISYIFGLANLTELEDYPGAIDEFSIAIQSLEPKLNDPNVKGIQFENLKTTLATFYAVRGRAHAANNEPLKAKTDYETSISYNENFYLAYIGLGNYFYNEREFSRAEEQYDKAIEINRKISSAYYGRGNSLYFQGKINQSIGDYLRAIDLNKENPSSIRIVLATVYYEDGKIPEAIEQLNLIIKSEDSDLELIEQAKHLLNIINFQNLPSTFTPTGELTYLPPTSVSATNTIFRTPVGSILTNTKSPPLLPTNTPTNTLFPTDAPIPTATLFPTNTPSGPRQCNDGIDNDGDGLTDLADPQCRNIGDNDESK